MAKVITWTPPLDKPANCVATPVSGGYLADDTYYFRIYATDQTEDRNPFRSGVISDEFSATISGSNNQISLTWDAVTDATNYAVLVTTTSGVYSGAVKIKSSGGSYYHTINTNSFTYDGTESKYYVFHSFLCPVDFPATLDKLNGRGLVTLSGGTEGDPITPEDINTAIGDTTYSTYDISTWNFQGSITGDNTEMHFQAKNMKIWMAGLVYQDKFGTDSEFILGRALVSYDTTIYRDGCTMKQVPNGFQRPFQTSGKMKFYASKLVGTVSGDAYYALSSCQTQTLLGYTNYVTFKQSEIWGYPIQWFGNVTIEDTLVAGNWTPYHNLTDFTNAKRLKVYGMNLESLTNDGYFNNITFIGYNSGNKHLRVNQSKTTDIYFTDCDVESADPAHPNLPSIYWNGTYGQAHTIHWRKTFNLKVIDVNGDAIASANVVIKDVDGVEVVDSPFTTDASGDIAETILTQCIFTRKDGSGYGNGWDDTDQTNKYPYTITVTKDGYASKTVKYTITEETADQMLLSPEGSTQIYDSTIYDSIIY